ncbi:glycosyl hydrolase family 28-related protein [Pedobacter endophyticus]|uniref:Right-handed parallel beta-helix repeat-containing protein n=1 Tax=Pedobacter endophyticus TaxID=2789740 RepID=A0A7S9Q0D8_9SPHI|nr:right-handed parallel beta-helix repeat-containing protein [Pedobacter endophyticus]QPH41288.1 right-handed parallel beta-helix repeat-containing protein [Pedobacter endophyticus]
MSRFFLIISLWLLLCSCNKEKVINNGFKFQKVDTSDNYFQSYGLAGDGITDDTEALQKLVNDSATIYLKAGNYLISQTIVLRNGLKFIGQEGTTIIAGRNMQGTLLQNGRFLFANESNNILISNVRFRSSDRRFEFSEWNNACIFVLNSTNVTVDSCFFDFELSYSSIGMEAVWISGSKSKQNIIKNNKVHTLGIKYAENGADFTLVENNVLTNAYSNAITANGNNAGDEIEGCKVIKNTILNAGRMGIEDWGNTNGTVIEGNKLTGTGVDPAQEHDGIGISAVGVNVNVLNNEVTNSRLYAIEARGNYGVQVTGNKLLNNPLSTAIILNFTFDAPKANLAAAKVSENEMENCEKGVHIFGDYQAEVSIELNVFRDVIAKAISLESGSSTYKIQVLNNKFLFTVKANSDRYAFFSYTHYEPGAANQIVYASDNSIEYAGTASGGAGIDFGFVIRTDRATINNLVVKGNNNRNAGNIPVLAITTLGARPNQCVITNNHIYGSAVELNGFTNSVQKDNTVVN